MELLFIFISFLGATGVSLGVRNRATIEGVSILASFGAFIATLSIVRTVVSTGGYTVNSVFAVDSLGALGMVIIACVGLAATLYSVPYLRAETVKNIIGTTNVARVNSRVREYFILLNLFFLAMFLSVSVVNPIFAWVCIEATTLATAFLISFYDKPSATEAAWKYLIINAVGLLLAFLGTLLYLTAQMPLAEGELATWQSLLQNAGNLSPLVAQVAFIFILIGYGTKVGFAPMHTWKPDAYSKAPAPIGALFSGALLPVAFITILKFKVITDAAVGPLFSSQLLLVFGALSLGVAAFIILSSRNYKRVLAYSSIEHAGLMALGVGFGGVGFFAALLHMLFHSFVKSALFLTSGNFLLAYGSAKIANIRGAYKVLPQTSILFFAGFLAIVGVPPFGIFFTKMLILSAGISTYPFLTIAALLLMVIVFIGLLKHVTGMVFGESPSGMKEGEGSMWLVLPPLVLLLGALYLSFTVPAFLSTLITTSVSSY